ncbi:MAG: AzlC family ABC transporter permease [Actinomycetota bacterium]
MSAATDASERSDAGAARLASRDVAPVAAGLVPFAVAIGAASAANGLSFVEAVLTPAMLLAGSAQLAAVDLWGSGGGLVLVAGTAIVINLRLALYSAGLRRWFEAAPRWQQLLLACTLIDQSFLLCEERFATARDLRWRRTYYVTVSAWLVAVFLLSQAIGHVAGSGVPDGLGLHLAGPLVFAGMLARTVRRGHHLVAAVVAGAVLVATAGLPGGLALPVAAIAGVVAASARSPEPRP